MKTEALSGRQLACITALFIAGSSSIAGNAGIAKRDTWIAVILATAAAVPLILMYARISSIYREKNLFEIIFRVFGKWLGRLVSLLTTLYCFLIGALVLRDFPEFVQTVSLPKTPRLVFSIIIGLLCAYLAKLGINSFGKAGILFSAVVGIIVILAFMLLLPNMDITHLKPVLSAPPDLLLGNTLKLFSFPFGETVLLLCLFCNIKQGQNKYKFFVTGGLIGGLYLLVSVLRNILTLGAENFTSLYFPSYNAISTINIGDFFQRLEVMVSSYLLLCDIIKISVAILASCLGAAKLFGIGDYKKIVFPVSVLMIAVSQIVFKNTMEFFTWFDAYLFYSLPFQVGIPLILWIWGEANRRKLANET